MKILCLADLHGDGAGLHLLSAEIASSDLILIAGDFTDFGGAAEMREMIEPFEKRRESVAVVAGNCDRLAGRKVLEDAGLSVDGRPRNIAAGGARLVVIGSGGSIFHKGFTPYERKDTELTASFDEARKTLDSDMSRDTFLVVISHNPPFGTDADSVRGSHVGSHGLRAILDTLEPQLWICGHIHESRSFSHCGKTLLINPGPLREGYYAVVKFDPQEKEPFSGDLCRL